MLGWIMTRGARFLAAEQPYWNKLPPGEGPGDTAEEDDSPEDGVGTYQKYVGEGTTLEIPYCKRCGRDLDDCSCYFRRSR